MAAIEKHGCTQLDYRLPVVEVHNKAIQYVECVGAAE
jgi:hypothetical protein